jgi:hypothetical protein
LDCLGIERLVDRHIELCELFDGTRLGGRAAGPLLITTNEGKSVADCLSDLVDRTLAAHEGGLSIRDPGVYALKVAVSQAIVELA